MKRQWAAHRQTGFTIVELLIVIVVIGILAAIVIVAYNGVQSRAQDSIVKQDLAALAKQYELYKVDNGTYPPSGTELATLNIKVSKSAYLVSPNATYNLLTCLTSDDMQYVIAASSKSGKRFYVGSASGTVNEYTGPTALTGWTGTNGYYVPCNDLLAGSTMPDGGCAAIGYCASWRPWVGG